MANLCPLRRIPLIAYEEAAAMKGPGWQTFEVAWSTAASRPKFLSSAAALMEEWRSCSEELFFVVFTVIDKMDFFFFFLPRVPHPRESLSHLCSSHNISASVHHLSLTLLSSWRVQDVTSPRTLWSQNCPFILPEGVTFPSISAGSYRSRGIPPASSHPPDGQI